MDQSGPGVTFVAAPVKLREPQQQRTRILLMAFALAGVLLFLQDAVRPAWSRSSSDFPNYYTAAVLVREHQPLHRFYDWAWFQQQITRTGSGLQLGGYVPQTPLTMLPFLPLAGMRPQVARRVWLILNLLFLGGALVLIASMTRFRLATVWLIALCSYPALRSNVLLGQYYLLLLAAFSLCAYCLARRWERSAGIIAAVTAALKLYGAPFLLFFAASKRYRAAWMMAATLLLCFCGAVLMFGRHDVEFFVRIILPRAIRGETLDPYNAGNGSAATLLRRLFIAEPELNPYPLIDSPALFAFLWTGFALLITGAPVLAGTAENVPMRRWFAWWMVAMLLASPNTASYTFAVLPLCSALLLSELSRTKGAVILAANVVITLPLWGTWRALFPRFWLLLFLFFVAGWQPMKRIRPMRAAVAGVIVFAVSAYAALVQTAPNPPGYSAVPQRHAIYSNAAALSRDTLAFEAIGDKRYELKFARGNAIETFQFPGHAFQPSVPDSGAPVTFEMVTPHGASVMMLDPATGRSRNVPLPVHAADDIVISPEGRLLAYTSNHAAYIFDGFSSRQVRSIHGIRDLSFSPDGQHLLYAAGTDSDSRVEEFALATNSNRVVLRTEGSLARPSLSSDGVLIAYATRPPWHNWTIEVKRTDGTAQGEISAAGCNCYSPAWRPGSDELIYSTDCRRGVLLPRLMRAHATSVLYKIRH